MKIKSTKRALIASMLSLLLCVSMLVGTTFAWFTDSVTSASNIIKSGNLKVTLEWMEGTKEPAANDSAEWLDASAKAIFDYNLWEPGYVCVRHIKIGNEGSLALKYMVAIEANGEITELADVIDVYYIDPAVKVTDRSVLNNLPAENYLGTLSEVLGKLDSTATGKLAANTADRVTIALKMQESAGNHYKNMSIGTDFSVKVFATQLDAEVDSFGKDYDEGAFLPVVYNSAELREALKAGGNIVVRGTMDADDILQPFTEYPGETVEYYVLGDKVTSLNGGTYTMDQGAKYGIYVDTAMSGGGKIALSDMKITANSKWSFVIENAIGGEVSVSNADITAQSGAGLYGVGGKVTLDNVKVNHLAFDPAYASTPWGATALAAAGATDMTINSGEYYGSTYGLYVYSSGGTVTINGGTFKAPVVVAADAQNGANTYVIINGGNFDGKFESVNVFGGSEALITINGGNFTNFSTTANKRITIKGGTFDMDPTTYVAEGYRATDNGNGTWTVSLPTASDATDFKNEITNDSGTIAIDGNIAVEDIQYAKFNVDTTIVGGTLTRESGNGNPLTVTTTNKVTFEEVTFESVKGGAVLATRTNGANIVLNDCVFNNQSKPSTGNVGVQVYAENVTMVFNGCTFNNMPIVTSASYPKGIKLEFNDCTFNWVGDNCPGMVQIANNLEIDVDFNDCTFTYKTDSQYTTAKNLVSYNWPEASTITFNNTTVIGNRNNDKIWRICSPNNKVTVNVTGTKTYTFNGQEIDFDTYLK